MGALQTEHEFTLPKGLIDEHGELHQEGVMRLATARDEIEPLRDMRVRENDAFLPIILLARVIVRIGPLENITPTMIQDMFAADVAYLQSFYNTINFGTGEEESVPFAVALSTNGSH